MSEYQYIAFRALDEAVSEKNLAYMRRQSSRAQITPWSFDNEYHFGDFRGNAFEMLRRGYDFHLPYSNFGIRTLLIRLPNGFPDSRAAKAYLDGESIWFRKDKKGRAGTLAIEPMYEPDVLDDMWDLSEILNRLLPLRSEILDGDLRPLYLAHLAVACDCEHDPEETIEAPVPPGLKKPTDAQRALAEFYGIEDALIAAAAQESGPLPAVADQPTRYAEWLADQPEKTKDAWLLELLSDPGSSVRTEIRTRFEKTSPKQSWPTVRAGRTLAQLRAAAEEIRRHKRRRAAARAARGRPARTKKR